MLIVMIGLYIVNCVLDWLLRVLNILFSFCGFGPKICDESNKQGKRILFQ